MGVVCLIFSHSGERASGGMMHKAVVFVLVNSSSGARGMWNLLNPFSPSIFVFVLCLCSLSQSVRYKFKSLKPYSIIIIPYSLLSLLEM